MIKAIHCSSESQSKIGGRATEDVILQLIRSKCLPALLYGLEACPLRKADNNSLDFVVNRLFMKLFKTSNIDTVIVTVVQSFSLNFRALFSNNVVGNFLRNIVHVTMSIVNLFNRI